MWSNVALSLHLYTCVRTSSLLSLAVYNRPADWLVQCSGCGRHAGLSASTVHW